MEYIFTEEQRTIMKLAKRIADKIVKPNALKYDSAQTYPYDMLKALADTGLTGVYIDQEYGGIGGGTFELAIVIEQLSRECAGMVSAFAATALASYSIILFGSEEQKKKYLPKIAAGNYVGAFALTEEGAGSDVGAVQTCAQKKETEYILNGTKQWISNGGEADFYIVIARTNPELRYKGLSAFIVNKDQRGLIIGKKENKMGICASSTTALSFEGCRISASSLIGAEGDGFKIAMTTLDYSRTGIAAQALGIAQGAYEMALEHVNSRIQFGKPLSSIQAVQHILGNMVIKIEAVRALLYNVCRCIDKNHERRRTQAAIVKVFASDAAMRITTDAVQLMGGYGYMKEYPAEKRMRDAKITQIYEGSNQVLLNIIGKDIIHLKS